MNVGTRGSRCPAALILVNGGLEVPRAVDLVRSRGREHIPGQTKVGLFRTALGIGEWGSRDSCSGERV